MSGSDQCISTGPAVTPEPTIDPPDPTDPPQTDEPTVPTDPPSTTTREPGEGDWRRTVIYLYGETQVGQDLFLRGGIDHDQRPGHIFCLFNKIYRSHVCISILFQCSYKSSRSVSEKVSNAMYKLTYSDTKTIIYYVLSPYKPQQDLTV